MTSKKVKTSAAPYLPTKLSLKAAQKAVQDCKGCDLYKNATQAVFGEGLKKAKILVIGEVPGDKEDLEGHPFVGPAGRILSEALEELGIDRKDIYVTNAVKHFKWKPRGKRRLHQKPSAGEVNACKPWLEREISLIQPSAIICLGSTAAYSIFGRAVTIRDYRSKLHKSDYSDKTIVTSHPSSILRQTDRASKEKAYRDFVEDLRLIFASK